MKELLFFVRPSKEKLGAAFPTGAYTWEGENTLGREVFEEVDRRKKNSCIDILTFTSLESFSNRKDADVWRKMLGKYINIHQPSNTFMP